MEHKNLNNQESTQLGIGAVSGSFLFDKTMLEKATILSLTYANKAVKDAENNLKMAIKLWGTDEEVKAI